MVRKFERRGNDEDFYAALFVLFDIVGKRQKISEGFPGTRFRLKEKIFPLDNEGDRFLLYRRRLCDRKRLQFCAYFWREERKCVLRVHVGIPHYKIFGGTGI